LDCATEWLDVCNGYNDCNDGDMDSNNDSKVDTADYNAPSVVINEVLFYLDNTSYPCQTEYVEIYNSTASTVNITGYTITDEDASFSYAVPQLNGADIVLQAGERAVVSLDDVYFDFYDSGVYYLFTGAHQAPSDEFGDPGAASEVDRADQISLYDSAGTIVDYVGWSDTTSPSLDFRSDDTPALLRTLWQDDAFRSTQTMPAGYAMARISDGFDTNDASDWDFESTNVCGNIITRAFVVSFGVYREAGQIVVTWQTSGEDGTIGFDLLRRESGSGPFVRVNDKL
jgi:hypothetical protein